jgi:hypothetical protein
MNIRYRVNEPDVTYESFDTEVLVINLKNGNYYSLLGSAIPIWQLLAQGQPVDEVCLALTRSSQADEAVAIPAVHNFVADLEKESLLVRLGDAPAAGDPAPVTLPTAFTPPVLDRYTDMQQLLLMDPIHEVDATGWPVAKAPDKAGP